MNYFRIDKNDIANGTGVRVTLWCSGCDLRCEGCHNPQLWDYKAGTAFDEKTMNELLAALRREGVSGLTLTGGHPLDEKNIRDVYNILNCVRYRSPQSTVWLYTGYTLDYEDFVKPSLLRDTLLMCDIVVDGRYEEGSRDTTLAFRGSKNQRLIDVENTVRRGSIQLYY